MFGQVTNLALSGFVAFRDIAARGAAWVVEKVYGLREQTIRVVNSLAADLYNAGANMINSLTRGILSQLGNAVSAAERVVGGIRDFFPSSPAKRGPFSGRGYTLYSGQNLVEAFGKGIESRRGWLDTVMGRALGAGTPGDPLIPSSGLFAPSLAGSSAGGTSSLAGLTFTRTGPNVNVYIGNDQLTGYVQTVVDEDTAQRDRLAAQGVRGI